MASRDFKLNISRQQLAHRMGRLRKLESMGLAKEVKPGIWQIKERTEDVFNLKSAKRFSD